MINDGVINIIYVAILPKKAIYIGVTINLPLRINQHKGSGPICSYLSLVRKKIEDVVFVQFACSKSRYHAEATEISTIKYFRNLGKFNVLNRLSTDINGSAHHQDTINNIKKLHALMK